MAFISTNQKGGNGGSDFNDLDDFPQITNYRLVKINYWSSGIFKGIQFEWEGPVGQIVTGRVHGSSSGTFGSFTLAQNERIIVMTGRSGSRVDALTLITNQGRSVNFGGNGGSPFEWVINLTQYPNITLHHLSGKSGSEVDALRAYFTEK